MQEIEFNDEILEFPDDMPDEEIIKILEEEYTPQQQTIDPTIPQPSAILDRPNSIEAQQEKEQSIQSQQPKKRSQSQILNRPSIMQEIEQLPILGGVVKGAENVRLGLGQTIANFLAQTGIKEYEDYAKELNTELAQRQSKTTEEQAIPQFIGEVAGSAVLGGGGIVPSSVVGAASTPYIATEGQEGNFGEFLKQKAIQTGVGIVAGGAVKGLQKLLKKPPQILTSDELKKVSSQAYKKADDLGGILTPDRVNLMVDQIEALKPQTEIGKMIGGETPFTKLVDKVSEIKDRTMSLSEAQELDEFLGDAVDSFVEQGRLTKQGKKILDIQNILRDVIETTNEKNIIGGSKGFKELKKAREYWKRSRKLADIEKIILRGEGKDQPATIIRNGFQTLRNNPKRIAGYTKAEKKAIAKAANTGSFQDITRIFGSRLIPIITGAGGAGLTATAGSVLGSNVSRGIGAKIQADKAREVAEIIASGGKKKQKKPLLKEQKALSGAGAASFAILSEKGIQQTKVVNDTLDTLEEYKAYLDNQKTDERQIQEFIKSIQKGKNK